tara:strand:+ start:479 stop:784 length:306 start_codon:yes stop_codon:yes gene_type:complete
MYVPNDNVQATTLLDVQKTRDVEPTVCMHVTVKPWYLYTMTIPIMFAQFGTSNVPTTQPNIQEVRCAQTGTIYYKHSVTGQTAWRRATLTQNAKSQSQTRK